MKKLRNNNRAGFTMLEMMIIVVIIGILAGLAAPSFFNWIPKMKLKNDARQSLNYLRQARSQAVAKNNQYGIYFEDASSQVYYFKDTSSPENSTYETGSDSLIEPPFNLEQNVTISQCSFTGNTVIFYPNGSASTSGSIILRDGGSTDAYSISILASTGRVKLERTAVD